MESCNRSRLYDAATEYCPTGSKFKMKACYGTILPIFREHEYMVHIHHEEGMSCFKHIRIPIPECHGRLSSASRKNSPSCHKFLRIFFVMDSVLLFLPRHLPDFARCRTEYESQTVDALPRNMDSLAWMLAVRGE